jgi:hypothetical protein
MVGYLYMWVYSCTGRHAAEALCFVKPGVGWCVALYVCGLVRVWPCFAVLLGPS